MRNSGNHAMKEETSRWREWLREHGARLLLFARQQSRRQEDAEDILQEALVKLARKVSRGCKARWVLAAKLGYLKWKSAWWVRCLLYTSPSPRDS